MSTTTERAVFAVELKNEVSAPAQDAARALVDLKAKIEAGSAKLREMQAAMSRLKQGGGASAESIKALRTAIDAQKASVSSMQGQWLSLGGAFGEGKKKAEAATEGIASVMAQAQSTAAPTGALTGRMQALGASLATNGPALLVGGLVAVVAAGAAALASIVAMTSALTQFAFASADARRTEMLRLEGLMTIRRFNRGGAGSAQELVGAIDRVAGGSALARDEISGYGEQLYRAGFRGNELASALEAVGTTASVQGDRYAQRFIGMARHTRAMGGSVVALADTIRSRIGGIAQRQANGFGVQIRRLREDMAHLFDGLDIEPALRGLRSVTELFSQQHAFGRALSTIFRTLFNPLLRGGDDAGVVIRRFLIGAMLGVLRLGTAVLRIRNAFAQAFGPSTVSRTQVLNVALAAGSVTALVLARSLYRVFEMVIGVVSIVRYAAGIFDSFRASMTRLSDGAHAMQARFAASGKSLVEGFVSGIRGMIPAAQAAVMSLATTASTAHRSALEIRSPSRVFARLGREIPRGLAAGIESESGGAQQAASGIVEAPRNAARAGASGGVAIGELHVHTQGSDASSIAEAVREALVSALRGLATETGAPT